MGVANLEENMQEIPGVEDSVAESQVARNSYLEFQDDIDRVQSVMGKPKAKVEEPVQEPEQDNTIERNIVAIREELERERREKEELKANFEIWKNALHKQNIPEPPMKKNPLEDYDEEDAIPKKVYQEKEHEWQERYAALQRDINELRLASRYPDYKEIVDEYAAPLIKEKPHLAAGYYSAPDPWQYVYDLGVLAKQSKQQAQAPVAQEKPKASESAKKMVDNSRKPGNLAMTGGQGSFHHVKDWATMSDADFEAEVARIHGQL